VVNKFDTVVLAAGLSTRMGAFKPLLPFGQSTIVETVIDTALEVSERVIVVMGFRAQDIVNLKRWDERVVFVENKQYAKGMFSSVKVGAAQIQTLRFFIALGDQPQIPAKVYQKLIAAEKADIVQPSFHRSAGHPILASEKVRTAILAADENDSSITPKTIINQFKRRFVTVYDEEILLDLDTPNDYGILQSTAERIAKMKARTK